MSKHPLIKKLAIGFGALFGLLLLAALILPLVINVDSYRPQIVAKANEFINGKLEMGKLTLSLWGRVRVEVDGLSVQDANQRKVVSVKDVSFDMPFLSVLSGSPSLTFRMDKPDLLVVKDKKGKMNVMTLAKTASAEAPVAEKSSGGSSGLPALLIGARLGVDVKSAHLVYADELKDLKSEVNDLNVRVRDLSLSRKTDIEVTANLDTKMGKVFDLKGPVKLTAKVDPKISGGQFQSASVETEGNFTGLVIAAGGAFFKGDKIPAKVTGKFDVAPDSVRFEELTGVFHNATLKISGTVSDLKNEVSPTMQMQIASNEIDLNPWSQLVPMLKEYELGGKAGFSAKLSGTTVAPQYTANFDVKGLTAKAPNLKAEPKIDAEVRVVTDKVEKLLMTMKAPGNDLKVTGTVVSFTSPKVALNVESTGMDLDQLVVFPPPGKKKAAGRAPVYASVVAFAADEKPAPVADYDKSLDALRKNPIAAATTADVKARFAFIKAYNVKMNGIEADVDFKNLILAVNRFKMALFDGTVAANATVKMAPTTPDYRFAADVSGLNMQQAVASQMELFKNTVTGIASFKMDGSGASFNPEPAKKALNAKGSLSIKEATFQSIDVARMVSEGIGKTLNDLGNKIPVLKGKTLNVPNNIESKYTVMTSNFTISGGRFNAPDFVAKAVENKGLDLKGATAVGLVDLSLNADWEVRDTYNLTKARDLSIEQAGTRVDHVLAEGNEPVKFPIHVGGTISAPQYNYAQIPLALGKVAMDNIGRAATDRLKAEAKAKAGEQVKKLTEQAPKQLQDALKGFGF